MRGTRGRRRRGASLLLLLCGLVAAMPARAQPWAPWLPPTGPGACTATSLALRDDDRVLVLAPHPDDEVLGAGGVLREATRRHLPVRVVFLTSGDSNEWSFLAFRHHPVVMPHAAVAMGKLREQEALAADASLGLAAADVTFLGYPDHETLDIFRVRWGTRAPVRGPLTRARAVPYDDALHPGAPYRGEAVLEDLESVLREFRPTQVFVSHPADHHPDHAALYLFTRVALWDLAGEMQPRLHPFLVHYPGWPRAADGGALVPPRALGTTCGWEQHPLDESAVGARRQALALHRTQYGYSAARLLPLLRENELYGDAGTTELADGAGVTLTAAAVGATEARSPKLALRRTGGALEVALATKPAVEDGATLIVTLDGWRGDRPFGQMPKLELRVGARRWSIAPAGGGAAIAVGTLRASGGALVARVPLGILGQPTRLLVQARGGSASATTWWAVELPAPPAAAPLTAALALTPAPAVPGY